MTTELILPEQKHSLSKSVASELARIDGLLHPSIRQHAALRQQFWASVIVEVNGLKPDTEVASVMIAIANLCQVGLTFGKQLGHAYLVPFKGKAQLIVGYKGFLKLAFDSGFLDSLTTELVLKDESCRIWVDETGRKVLHEIPLNRPAPDNENVEGAYCVYRTKSGQRDVVHVQGWELRKLFNNAHPRSVWKAGVEGYQGQCLKTPIRRAAKLWDQTPELARAVYLDEQADRDEPQENDAIEPPRLSEEDGLRATLMATLRDKVGCRTDSDRAAVLSSLGVHGETTEVKLDALMAAAERIGWENILIQATSI